MVDTSDYEWNVWSPILLEWFCYAVPFVILSILLKRISQKCVALTSIGLSFHWVYNLLGLPLTLFIYIQPIMFLVISKISSIFFVWIVCLSFSLGLHSEMLKDLKVILDSISLSINLTHLAIILFSCSYLVKTAAENTFLPFSWHGLKFAQLVTWSILRNCQMSKRARRIFIIIAFTSLFCHRDPWCSIGILTFR